MLDWTAVLVLVTGCGLVCGAFAYVTKLVVRAEVANLHMIFLPRSEAAARDREINRRLHELHEDMAR